MPELNNIKINMAEIKKDISFIKEKMGQHDRDFHDNGLEHKEIKDMITANLKLTSQMHTEHLDKMEAVLESHAVRAQNKFAGKWVEYTMIWAARIIGAALILGALGVLAQAYILTSS